MKKKVEGRSYQNRELTLGNRIRRHKASYIMIAPYFILFFLFTVLPVLISITFSFTDFNVLEFPDFTGWDNYIRLFLDDDIFKIALKNTLIFAVITGPISYFMCLIFAWIINEFKGKLRAFLTLIHRTISGNTYVVWNLILRVGSVWFSNGLLIRFDFMQNAIIWM